MNIVSSECGELLTGPECVLHALCMWIFFQLCLWCAFSAATAIKVTSVGVSMLCYVVCMSVRGGLQLPVKFDVEVPDRLVLPLSVHCCLQAARLSI